MDQATRVRLTKLPPLQHDTSTRECKVCRGAARLFDVVDFNKTCNAETPYPFGLAGIEVPYFRCHSCGFAFTEFFDDWSAEDFSRFVYNADYVKADPDYVGERSRNLAAPLADLLMGHGELSILDYGSGSGVLAKELAALGYRKVTSYDPFSHPRRPDSNFDLITCFEVIEHSTMPWQIMTDIASLLKPDGAMLCGTCLQPANINEIRANWWYMSPRNGHVSIYTPDALSQLARGSGLTLFHGDGQLAFARAEPAPVIAGILARIGKPHVYHCLYAPEAGAAAPDPRHPAAPDESCWQGVEPGPGGTRFRWTAKSELTWKDSLPVGRAFAGRIVIPYVNEIEPGFAARCRLQVERLNVPLTVEGGRLVAESEFAPLKSGDITLVTPEPRRPSDLRPVSDSRSLGLAITTGPA